MMRKFVVVSLVALAAATSARAQVTYVDLFKNLQYTQTGAAQPVTESGAFVGSRLVTKASSDAQSVTGLTSTGGTLIYSRQAGGTNYEARQDFTSKAAMESRYGAGTAYVIAAAGGTSGASSGNFLQAPDTYSAVVPYVTGGSYAALQGLDAAIGTILTINGFTAPAGASESFVFATIYRLSDNALAYAANFLAPTTTTLTIGGGVLAAGTDYYLDLDYSVRRTSSISGFPDAALFQGFERRTQVSFRTVAAAVPEPAAWGLMVVGFGMTGAALRRNRVRHPARA